MEGVCLCDLCTAHSTLAYLLMMMMCGLPCYCGVNLEWRLVQSECCQISLAHKPTCSCRLGCHAHWISKQMKIMQEAC